MKSQPQIISGFVKLGPSLTEDHLHGRSSTAIGLARPIGVQPITIYPTLELALDSCREPVVETPPQKLKATPTPPESVFTADRFPSVRLDAPELVADAPIDFVSSFWMQYTPELTLPSFFDDADLIDATLQGYGPQVKRLALLKKNLSSFAKVGPNSLRNDETPERKILVTRWTSLPLPAMLRRVGYLRQYGELKLVVFEHATGSVEAWWNVAGLSKAKVEHFYARAVGVHADPRSGLRGWRAINPGSPSTSGRSCLVDFRNLGLVRDHSHYDSLTKRNFVLFLDASARPKGK